MVFLCGIMWNWTEKMVIRMMEKYPITAVYGIWTKARKNVCIAPELDSVINHKFDFDEIHMGNYENCIYYDEMPPLDKNILDAMAPYSSEILKMMDRTYYFSSEERFMYYHTHLRYWNFFLDKAKVDFFLAALTPHGMFDFIILRLCQIKKIPVIQFEIMPFMTTKRLLCFSDYESFDQRIVELVTNNRQTFRTANEIVLSDDVQKEYEMLNDGKEKFVVQILKINKKDSEQDFHKKSVVESIRRALPKSIKQICRRVRMRLQWNVYKRDKIKFAVIYTEYKWLRLLKEYETIAEKNPDLNVPYIYFPLQLQPELSTSPRGGWFVHQYLAIEMLSYYVPKEVYIYVKEHPAIKQTFFAARDVEHYHRIKALKNVKFIAMDVDTNVLIEHAAAVSSMTGSVGYEALYRKIPYIMFGNQMMKYSYGTFNVRNKEDCRKAIEAIFVEGFSFNDRDIKAFLKAIDEVTVKVELDKEDFFADNEMNIAALTEMYEEVMDKELNTQRKDKV